MRRTCVIVVLLGVIGFVAQADPVRVSTVSGTGFIVSPNGYILTNEHVVHGATEVTVEVGPSQTRFKATVTKTDAANDLALLKIEASRLSAVVLGDSNSVRVLDPIVAMGYPAALQFGTDLTTAEGQITSVRTNMPGREGKETFQTDAAIYHGSSGGPLFNNRGEVIGVNFAGIEGSEFYFAIPINEAIPILSRVPGFAKSQMGTAIDDLSAREIMENAAPAVVYVLAEIERPLAAFLPKKLLGSSLTVVEVSRPTHPLFDFSFIGPTLEDYGVEVEAQLYASAESQYGSITRKLCITLYDLEDEDDASAVFDYLDETARALNGDVLLRDTKAVGNLRIELQVDWGSFSTFVFWQDPFDPGTFWLLPENQATTQYASVGTYLPLYGDTVTVYPLVRIRGAVRFVLSDLVFAAYISETVDWSERLPEAAYRLSGWELLCDGCCCYIERFKADLSKLVIVAPPSKTYRTPLCVEDFMESYQTFLVEVLAAVVGE